MQGGGTGNHNKECNNYGCKAANDDIKQCIPVIFHLEPFFNHWRLHVKLHPWRDSGAYDPDDHSKVSSVEFHMWLGDRMADLRPMRFTHKGRNHIHEQSQTEYQEDAFGNFIIALDYQEPDQDSGKRNRNIFTYSKYLHAAGNPGEFSGRIPDICQ